MLDTHDHIAVYSDMLDRARESKARNLKLASILRNPSRSLSFRPRPSRAGRWRVQGRPRQNLSVACFPRILLRLGDAASQQQTAVVLASRLDQRPTLGTGLPSASHETSCDARLLMHGDGHRVKWGVLASRFHHARSLRQKVAMNCTNVQDVRFRWRTFQVRDILREHAGQSDF
jgi:hypothetical protein